MTCLEPLGAEDRLSQGDVIVWNEGQDYLDKAAVVVTADCDLVKRKHWGRVTVVPLIAASAYFDHLYLPKQLESMESDLLSIFGKAVQKSMGAENSQPPTQQVLETLIGLGLLPEPISRSDDAARLHSLIRQTRGLAAMKSAAQALDQALLIRNPKTKSLSAEKIRTFLDNPPGDCMILPAMEGLGSGIHIAFLRVMRELRDEDIALKTSEQDGIKGKRIGRLIPVIRYRLTQMLAQVFSDIGLPSSYEDGLKAEKSTFIDTLSRSKEEAA